MIKNKIKIVEKRIIETNSSSSHSLTLGKDNFIKPGDKEWDVNIKDRILYVPTCMDFGWEYFKFNTCQQKIQYLSGLFFYEGDVTIRAQKQIKKLKALLCKVFDIDDVVFEWVEDYLNGDLKEDMCLKGFNPEYTDFCPVTVDHESRDLKDEIIETEETLRSFLFSRDSWVFGGNDGAEAPDGFYKEEKQSILNATASINFPGLGKIDFRIYYPKDINSYLTESLNFIRPQRISNNILEYFVYDIEKKIVYPAYYIEEKDINKLDTSKYMEYRSVISYKGDYYCLFVQAMNEANLFSVDPEKATNWSKAFNMVVSVKGIRNRVAAFKEKSDEFVLVLESGLVKEDVDYKLFKIEINQDEPE